jgi:hypothetical protein
MAENPPTAVFRCTDPVRLDAWKAELDAGYETFNRRLKEYGERIGKHNFSIRRGWWKLWVMGYKDDDPKATPLNGWRRERDSDVIVPYRRTNVGKVVAAELEALEYTFPHPPGMPNMVLGDGYMGVVSAEKFGGDWYAWTTVPLRPADSGLADSLKEVDTDLWTPIKMSEFWTAKESHHG